MTSRSHREAAHTVLDGRSTGYFEFTAIFYRYFGSGLT
jgi:hypothetical protein